MPFYLRTGKRLPRRVTEIAVVFKKAPHLPFAETDTEELGHNQLVVRVQPDEGITLRFGSKVPGSSMEVRDVSMDFLYGEAFTESSPEAYERLLLDVLIGDATLFPRNEEVELSWKVIDPLEAFWAGSKPALYRAGEWGPGRPTRCWPATAGSGGGHDDTILWDTNGTEIVKTLAAERRAAGALASGLALTLVVVTEEEFAEEAQRAAATAASAHPCRLLVVVRRRVEADDRLDAEVRSAAGSARTRPSMMRMYGRLSLHAESVVLPLLASDAPVVTWWHGATAGQARLRRARRARRPAGHRRHRRGEDADGRAQAAGQGLRARRHRPGLDPHHALAGPAGLGVRRHGRGDHVRRRCTPSTGNPSAALLAGWLTAAARLEVKRVDSAGPGHHRRSSCASRAATGCDRPAGRRTWRRSPAPASRPAAAAEAARARRPARRGAAPAGRRPALRGRAPAVHRREGPRRPAGRCGR